jgi:hypothetical protein
VSYQHGPPPNNSHGTQTAHTAHHAVCPAHLLRQLLHEARVVVAHSGVGPGCVAEALWREALQLACSCLSQCLKQDGAAEAKLGKRPRRVGQALGGGKQWQAATGVSATTSMHKAGHRTWRKCLRTQSAGQGRNPRPHRNSMHATYQHSWTPHHNTPRITPNFLLSLLGADTLLHTPGLQSLCQHTSHHDSSINTPVAQTCPACA